MLFRVQYVSLYCYFATYSRGRTIHSLGAAELIGSESRRTMDVRQKRVLRWKRHLVSNSVQWSDDFVAGLKQRHLLSDVVLSQIQVLQLLTADAFIHSFIYSLTSAPLLTDRKPLILCRCRFLFVINGHRRKYVARGGYIARKSQ